MRRSGPAAAHPGEGGHSRQGGQTSQIGEAGNWGLAGIWRPTLSALCASLIGVGLARFAYTPLIPPLIDAEWFTSSQVVYLGAANLAGYLAGAISARWMVAAASAPSVLRAMMLLATAAFLGCAVPLSLTWFFLWRFVSGLAGGALMVLAAPTVLPHVPPGRRGLVGGAIFTGVGLGIAASGTLLPLLLQLGLTAAWLSLGAISLGLTLVAWGGWPPEGAVPNFGPAQPVGAPGAPPPAPAGLALKALYLEYGLNAVGLVPHMVFLVDFVARGLGQGLAAGAWYWVLFGIGAMLGPVLAGRLADRIGFRSALRVAFVAQAVCVGLLAITDRTIGLTISSLVVGAFVPGVVPLVLGRTQELVRDDRARQGAAWSVATVAFASGQAGAAYGLSFLFNRTGSYTLLFEIAVAALLLAFIIDIAAGRAGGTRNRTETA